MKNKPKSNTRETKVEEDPLEFAKKPHTVSALVLASFLIIYFAFQEDSSTEQNVKSGIFALSLVFVLFSMEQMRDGLFLRPHVAFWRAVMGITVLYLCSLVFLLFQSRTDARKLMAFIDPKLGVPLPEKDYAVNCDLYTPYDPESNFRFLRDAVYDEFILAHFLGWWGKMLLIRDVYLATTLSILFEILEVTFQHMLPNFKECWWDHIILDIVICNTGGILMGYWTYRFFAAKEYNWIALKQKKIKRLAAQFIPFHFDRYKWGIFGNYRRFLAFLTVIVCFSIVELNSFFLKAELWIPPPHPINIIRLCIWGLVGMPALREFFQFVDDPNCKRMGPMSWLSLAITGTETLICIKFAVGLYPNPAPTEVVVSWLVFLVVLFSTSLVYFTCYAKKRKSKTQ